MDHDLAPSLPLGFHVSMRLGDHRVVVASAAHRRCAARVMLEQGEERGLIAMAVADTHFHALLLTHRDAAGRFAHDVETALRWRLRLPARFEPASIRAVRTQGHLAQTYWYQLDQERRHGTDCDRAHDGTSLPDVIGARAVLVADGHGVVRRVCAGLGARVAAALPRVRVRHLLGRLGGARVLEPAGDVVELSDAAAAAVGAGDLHANGSVEMAAMCAAVHAAGDWSSRELATALDVAPRTVQRFRKAAPRPDVLRAVILQWRIRADLRRRAEEEARGLLLLGGSP